MELTTAMWEKCHLTVMKGDANTKRGIGEQF